MQLSPPEWFNIHGNFIEIFKDLKKIMSIMKSENEIAFTDPNDLNGNPNITTFKNLPGTDNEPGFVLVVKNNQWKIPIGFSTKFILLTEICFGGDWTAAASHVSHYLMGNKVNYIRVGCDFFKVISKETQYGGKLTYPKPWKKETITDDHTKALLSLIPKYDDFIIVPDNKSYQPVIKNCYNLYSPFMHTPFNGDVSEADIPVTTNFLKHIFQEHYDLAIVYMKVLYENPKQKLPILCLVSETNETGKTTFINFLEMIFGGNYVLVTPDDLTKQFNLSFATKNIIAAEEAFVEKSAGVEKVKALSTGKSIQMSRKFIDDQTLPFFGKIILCTNNVKDFMKIKDKEIRFWVREVPVIQGKKNNLIEKHLFAEIPKFLRFLDQQTPIDYENGSRQILSEDRIRTDALMAVKEESRSWLYKELKELIISYCMSKQITSFYASSEDIKKQWFFSNNNAQLNYIRKVLKEEMKLVPSQKTIRYSKFNESIISDAIGRPFHFDIEGDGIIIPPPPTGTQATFDNDDQPF